tara:strand:- start:165 stop:320 length:156 start_codon:yes stop_codon:yes gene_type:complete
MSDKTISTFVYSDTGKDIEKRFPNFKVSNIKETDDPLSGTKANTRSKEEYV